MAALSICSAGPEMDVRIRHRVAALGGVIERVQLYPSHHEFFIAVPEDKLQELLEWRTTQVLAVDEQAIEHRVYRLAPVPLEKLEA